MISSPLRELQAKFSQFLDAEGKKDFDQILSLLHRDGMSKTELKNRARSIFYGYIEHYTIIPKDYVGLAVHFSEADASLGYQAHITVEGTGNFSRAYINYYPFLFREPDHWIFDGRTIDITTLVQIDTINSSGVVLDKVPVHLPPLEDSDAQHRPYVFMKMEDKVEKIFLHKHPMVVRGIHLRKEEVVEEEKSDEVPSDFDEWDSVNP